MSLFIYFSSSDFVILPGFIDFESSQVVRDTNAPINVSPRGTPLGESWGLVGNLTGEFGPNAGHLT